MPNPVGQERKPRPLNSGRSVFSTMPAVGLTYPEEIRGFIHADKTPVNY
jgi:hypothetical protein